MKDFETCVNWISNSMDGGAVGGDRDDGHTDLEQHAATPEADLEERASRRSSSAASAAQGGVGAT
jgi:hypothetical protein